MVVHVQREPQISLLITFAIVSLIVAVHVIDILPSSVNVDFVNNVIFILDGLLVALVNVPLAARSLL